jgi:sterol 3beta-glucosyltransferase
MPEHFRGGEDENEDVTAPKNKDGISMNQPFLAMIARAGRQSQVDLSGMPEEDSEDTDDGGKQQPPYHGLDGASRLSRISKSNIFQLPSSLYEVSTSSRRRRRLSDDKTLHSLRKVKMVGRKAPNTDAQATQDMSSSQILTRFEPKEEPEQRQQGKTYSNLEIKRPSNDETAAERSRPSYRRSRHSNSTIICKGDGSATLAQRLQQIFEFETLEEVISGTQGTSAHDEQLLILTDYPCWLLQSILLQGNMYITQKHICFHAYIPKRHVRPLYFLRPSLEILIYL